MHTNVDQQTAALAARLRQLPAELPPPYGWLEFKRRSSPAIRPARAAMSWRHAAVAAGVVVVIAAVAVRSRINVSAPQTASVRLSIGDPRSLGRSVGEGTLDATAPLPPAAAANPLADAALYANEAGGRAARSLAIEHWLAALPQEPAVVRVGTRSAVTGLEDQLAQMDDLLASMRVDGAGRERLGQLQQERARLMGSLAQVRYAEVVDARSSP
jgi:hypothetical protein